MSKGSRKRPQDRAAVDAFWNAFDTAHGGLRGPVTREGPWCEECGDTGRLPSGECCTECRVGILEQMKETQ